MRTSAKKKAKERKSKTRKVRKTPSTAFVPCNVGSSDSQLRAGALVEVHSTTPAALNGRRGRCNSFDSKDGTWAVALRLTPTEMAREVKIPPRNLRLAIDYKNRAVELHSLSKRPELNGCRGLCGPEIGERYVVALFQPTRDTKVVRVRPANLKLLPTTVEVPKAAREKLNTLEKERTRLVGISLGQGGRGEYVGQQVGERVGGRSIQHSCY